MAVAMVHEDDGARLDRVIGAADAMNHSIPVYEEVRQVFENLANLGVLKREHDRFVMTDDVLDGLLTARSRRGGLFAGPKKGKDWLRNYEFLDREPSNFELTFEECHAACKTNRRSFQRRR